MSEQLLSIQGLDVSYPAAQGRAHILSSVDLEIAKGEAVGLVGESGSGKSTLALSLLGLLPANADISVKASAFGGRTDFLGPAASGSLRGTDRAIVFQDPMTALNPFFSIGSHLVDIQRRRFPDHSRRSLWDRAVEVLTKVGVQDAARRMKQYPHEFSGGMRQRVVIAMALLVEPKLLIADEPTTALDATIETQIVELLQTLRQETACSLLIVSHSMGLIAELCESVVVMYAGTVVEAGPVQKVLHEPRHPYTRALLACEIDPYESVTGTAELKTIPGSVPDLARRPRGCVFAGRCPEREARCTEPPPLIRTGKTHRFTCWKGAPA